MRGRLIVEGGRDPCANLALEEALFSLNEGFTVRVWENDRSVIIGRAQLASHETDLDYCRGKGIPVLRRFTAGGAVYNGPGNLNWSLFIGAGFRGRRVRYLWGASEVFSMCAALVADSLSRLGVQARFERPNRISTPEGKVSGMAAYVARAGLLCHGTALLSADLDEACRLTRPSPALLERRYVRSREAVMANLGLTSHSFVDALGEVAAEEADDGVARAGVTRDEAALARSLMGKYCDPRWNLGDPFEGGACV